uniref:Uncharacterized protein n=1 Tax=Oryza nivara TaxID=4536 RepID=A0A0E0I8T0_ORYNI
MAGGGGCGTRGAVAMVRDCELLSPTGCSDGEGTATEASARRWRRQWGYGAEMASLPLPLLLVLGLFVPFVESGRRWRQGLGLEGDDGRSRRMTITTLSILGCPRLTLDGLISNLKSFNTNAVFGIKHLRVGTLFSLRKEQYEELLSLLNTDKTQEVHNRGPKIPSC